MARDTGNQPRRQADQVYSITSASSSHSDDMLSREKRYGISMGIRTLCFVGAVVVWTTIGGWLTWVLIAGAVILPYTSVILANAGVSRQAARGDIVSPGPYGALGSGAGDRGTDDE